MTAVLDPVARGALSGLVDFVLPDELAAREPPEARGRGRDDVRLLVAWRQSGLLEHCRFVDMTEVLRAGDLLVVNTSATVPASVDGVLGSEEVEVHLSGRLPAGLWTVEVRHPSPTGSRPFLDAPAGAVVELVGGGTVSLLAPLTGEIGARPVRLWVSSVVLPGGRDDHLRYLATYGRPIRYGYVERDWGLAAYQTVFANEAGSAEMPSAARPFTAELVTRLVSAGVEFAPIVLHTGVSSPEAHELPAPEWYRVPATTARRVERAQQDGARVIAIGTTAVRALETVADEHGRVHAGEGWTDTVITPERGVRVVDGLLTGWHEPGASHLAMLEAVAGRELLVASYRAALEAGYRWHEFGDSHLILP
ncbi:MAG TPA: S-adenosylmethionine:tRNA ribosyltransferase-isomerase [Acidimicrobiales bacterium]|nr:S-adenosylmethionine:tRNA ribosyltransferase-isomerase [Acidimicrobiales bacterium]